MIRPLVLFALAGLAAASGAATAQTAAPRTAQTFYEEAFAREHVLRGDLRASAPDAARGPLVQRLRGVIVAYEDVVRRFPTSGYCDNALWQAAGLAREAVARWNQDRDRRTLLRMLNWLAAEYPASQFVPSARSEMARLTAGAWPASPPASPSLRSSPPGPTPQPPALKTPAPDAAPTPVAEIRSIRRAVLPEVVRVTIELDHEVPYQTETLDQPPRLFFDFSPSRPSAAVADGTFSYADDVVREVRIGVHPAQTTRVVIDLEGVKRYSVFQVYDPYRLVVDCERERPRPADRAAPGPELSRPVLAAAPWVAVYQHLPGAVPSNPPPGDPVTAPAPAVSPGTPAASRGAPAAPRTGPPTAVETPAPPATNRGGGYSLARQLGLGVSRIVIDPGHGGLDPGAKGQGITEAQVVLDVALRLEGLLRQNPGVDVVLTRRTDEYVSLEERTAIANRAQADLFLSIHANAHRSRTINGVETYYLNFARTANAAAVAARENAAAGMSMGNLPDIVKAIALNTKQDESKDFAALVQQAMVRRLSGMDRNLKNLGVKTAPFVVLIGAAMPSVLVEIAFITNGQQARLLRDAAYRQRIAEALFDSIKRYQNTLKTGRPAQLQ